MMMKKDQFFALSFGEIIDQSKAQSHIDEEATTTSILSEKKFFF